MGKTGPKGVACHLQGTHLGMSSTMEARVVVPLLRSTGQEGMLLSACPPYTRFHASWKLFSLSSSACRHVHPSMRFS